MACSSLMSKSVPANLVGFSSVRDEVFIPSRLDRDLEMCRRGHSREYKMHPERL